MMTEYEKLCLDFWRQCYVVELQALVTQNPDRESNEVEAAKKTDICLKQMQSRWLGGKIA